MWIEARLSELSDKELETLHGNAVRLSQAGSPKQREEAEAVLPLVSAAVEERTRARTAASVEARRTKARERAVIAKQLKNLA